MKSKFSISLHLMMAFLFVGSCAIAQQINTPAPSPGSELNQKVGLVDITIEYSRPGKKGREIYGDLVPFGEMWRTGANAATKFSISDDIQINDKTLPEGTYALLTVPGEDEWKINFYIYESASWPTYADMTPVLTTTVTPKKIDNTVETFTIDVNNIRNEGATLDLAWENTLVSIPFSVNTKEKVMAQINQFAKNPEMGLSNAYYNAASYMLQEKENLELALDFASKAADLRPNAYWIKRTEALLLAEMKKYDEAIKAAEKSKELAEKAGNQQYVNMNEYSIKGWKKMK